MNRFSFFNICFDLFLNKIFELIFEFMINELFKVIKGTPGKSA